MLKLADAVSQMFHLEAITASTPRRQNCSAIGPEIPATSVSAVVSPLLHAFNTTRRGGAARQQDATKSAADSLPDNPI